MWCILSWNELITAIGYTKLFQHGTNHISFKTFKEFKGMGMPCLSTLIQLQVGEKTVHVARFMKNLTVCFDTSLTRERQVNASVIVAGTAYCNISYTSQYIWQMLARHWHRPWKHHDCGSALLNILPSTLIECLQWIFIPTAWLVICTCKREHTTPALHSLRWLPVIQR